MDFSETDLIPPNPIPPSTSSRTSCGLSERKAIETHEAESSASSAEEDPVTCENSGDEYCPKINYQTMENTQGTQLNLLYLR